MTIIVYKDGVMASDSRIVVNSGGVGEHVIHGPKIELSPCGRLYVGIVGNPPVDVEMTKIHEDIVTAVLMANHSKTGIEDFPVENFDAIIATKTCAFLIGDSIITRYEAGVPMARGSGEDYARIAMVHGYDAIEAVRFAISMDSLCSGEINIHHCKKLKPMPKEKRK